jgi:penicillin amidase
MIAEKQSAISYNLRVFSLVWLGQMISVVGSQFTSFALGFWIYRRTGSATQLALVGFFAVLPSIVLAPISGVLVDRYDRRWVMILSDIGAALSTLAIWLLFTTGHLEFWHIYVSAAFTSVCDGLQIPAYTAATTLLVPKEHLGRANGMIQLGPAVAQVIAPVMAGILVMIIGVRGVILIDLITFLFAVLTLLFVRIPKPEATTVVPEEKSSLLRDAAYGWTYIKTRPGLMGLLLFFTAINFTQSLVIILIDPLVLSFASASVWGTVASIAGCGMFLGALVMSAWGGPDRRINGVLGFTLLRATLLFLGGLQPSAPLIAAAAFVFLFSSQITVACSQAIWQSKVAPDVQGRVFAMRQMIAWITLPVAYLSAGPLADNLFDPLLAADGLLAGSVGRVIGTGPGRGIGFLFIVLGILNILITIVAYSTPHIRLVEDELPDAVGDSAPVTGEVPHGKERKRKKMKLIGKWLAGIGIVLLVIAIALGGVGTWFVRRPWPQVSGTVAVSGVSAPVEVIRDKWGVPHIYAQNEHDLFFTQGYVHAQDRLWQMYFNRHLSSGRLSEIFGQLTVDTDLYMRTRGSNRAAEKEWESLDDSARAILEAYAQGVNAYIETHRDRLPLEFTLLGVSPSPWTPVDTLTIGRMFSVILSWNHRLELLRARLIDQLGVAAAEQLMVPYSNGSLLLPPESYSPSSGIDPGSSSVQIPYLENAYQQQASNNWVVHGSRTATGLPLLANDTHLPFGMPSTWYENGLHGERFDSVGFTFPGVPLIIIGHNERIAWGLTDLGADTEDVYIEKLNDAQQPTQYQFRGEWRDLEVVQETIEVKDSEPVTVQVYMTQHGPILDRELFSDPQDTQEPLALQSSAGSGGIFEALLLLNQAANWNEFRQALRSWQMICEHFVYADVEGNIGYQAAGKLPLRSPQHQGLLPVPGWTGEYEWQGFFDYEDLYSVLNPPKGYFATANDQAFPADYPYPQVYGLDWTIDGRVQVINDTLAANARVTIQDVQNLQADTYSVAAETLRPYLLAVEPQNDLQARALAQVRDWDLHMETDRTGATVYEAWYWFFVQNILADELDEDLLNRYLSNVWHTLPAMQLLLPQPDSPWFDDVTTPQVETRDDIILRSLADAVNRLSELYGDAPDQWTWGKFHTVTLVHQPLGDSGIPLLEKLFNSRTIPIRGSQDTVNLTLFDGDTTFEVYQGVSQRFILDLSDWDNSLAINSTGQSEHLFHPHRDDMIPMWANVEYHPMLFTRQAVEANAESTLTLVPR